MAGRELVSSAGHAGVLEERGASRAYLIPTCRVADLNTLVEHQRTVINGMTGLGKNRGVLRTRLSGDTLMDSFNSLMPVEAAIPIGQTGDYIVTFAHNSTIFNEQKMSTQSRMVFEPRPVTKSAVSRIEKIIQHGEYRMSNTLTPDDAKDLMNLWWVFGWTWKGINDFIDQYNSSADSPWFSAVRDKSGRIVSAVQGDKVEYADHLSVEVTEFSTDPNHGEKGLCTAALSGLVAQIVSDTLLKNDPIKDKNPKNLPVVVYSELNLDSTSFVVAQALGFQSPNVVLNNQTIVDQTLRENVFVIEKSDGLEKLWLGLNTEEQKNLLLNESFYRQHLRNFVVMHLPNDIIESMFNFGEVEQILKFYNQTD